MSIDRKFRQTVAELELLSHGKCAALNSSGAGENTAVLPHGELKPPHEYWRARYQAAGEHERPGILEHARRELEIWKKRQAPAVTESSEEDWILEDGAGYTPEVVARRFNTTPARIRSLRVKKQRDMETGQPLVGTRSVPKLDELIGSGMGARQIAMLTGEKRSTVQDAISKFRKAA